MNHHINRLDHDNTEEWWVSIQQQLLYRQANTHMLISFLCKYGLTNDWFGLD